MQAIGDNVARGLGMMGALSLIRFRSNLKEPRDMIFIFAGLAIGIANGVYSYTVAIAGTLGFSMAAFALFYSPFGSDSIFDGILRFSIPTDRVSAKSIEDLLKTKCKRFNLINLREVAQGNSMHCSYQIKLNKKCSYSDLLIDIKGIETVRNVNFLLQESTVEV